LLVKFRADDRPVTGIFSVPVPTDAVQSFAVYKTPYNAGLGSFFRRADAVETKPPRTGELQAKEFIPSVLGRTGA